MLVLKRRNGQWSNIKVTREKLQSLLEQNNEPELRFRVYNISTGEENLKKRIVSMAKSLKESFPDLARDLEDIAYQNNGPARVDIAFEDPERNFEIQRPERVIQTSK